MLHNFCQRMSFPELFAPADSEFLLRLQAHKVCIIDSFRFFATRLVRYAGDSTDPNHWHVQRACEEGAPRVGDD